MRLIAQDRILWGIGRRLAKRAHQKFLSYEALQPLGWRLLALLNVYRLLLSSGIVIVASIPTAAHLLGLHAPRLFGFTGLSYFLFALLEIYLIWQRSGSLALQTRLGATADIVAAFVVTQAMGGNLGLLAMLVVMPVAATNLMLSMREGLFYAALGTLAALGGATATNFGFAGNDLLYTQAGLIGGFVFVLALSTHALSTRIAESEILAERRAAELRTLNALNRYVIEQMHTGVVVCNVEGEILNENPAARRLLHRNHRLQLAQQMQKGLSQGRRQFRLDQKDGPTLNLQVLPLGASAQSDRLIFLEDTTETARQAQQMKLASLGRLTASIAHQIRNPLAAITHAGQLLSESTLPSPREEHLVEIIDRQSHRLDRIVEDILSLSRRETPDRQWLDLSLWLRQFAHEYQERRPGDHAPLKWEVPPQPVRACVDPSQLSQIVSNLANNAFIHGSSPRGVLLKLDQSADEVYLDVVDWGPGVPETIQNHLFEPFHTSHAHGTGLGLFIARELAEANGLHLTAQTNRGNGTRFRISFQQSQT